MSDIDPRLYTCKVVICTLKCNIVSLAHNVVTRMSNTNTRLLQGCHDEVQMVSCAHKVVTRMSSTNTRLLQGCLRLLQPWPHCSHHVTRRWHGCHMVGISVWAPGFKFSYYSLEFKNVSLKTNIQPLRKVGPFLNPLTYHT